MAIDDPTALPESAQQVAEYDHEAKGRAHYYLGVIAYHAHDFDVARQHLETAADTAAEPEIGYAAEALRWRFQEEG